MGNGLSPPSNSRSRANRFTSHRPCGNETAPQMLHCIMRNLPMADTEKAEMPNIKKQTPRPAAPKTGPVVLGAGLESPRSPHC
jgi:hypothetical protein